MKLPGIKLTMTSPAKAVAELNGYEALLGQLTVESSSEDAFLCELRVGRLRLS